METEDALYNAGGQAFRSGFDSRQIGNEIDVLVQSELGRHVNLYGGYSHVFAGDAIEVTGPSEDIDFFAAARKLTWQTAKLAAFGSFHANDREGPWVFYHVNGNVQRKGTYRAGAEGIDGVDIGSIGNEQTADFHIPIFSGLHQRIFGAYIDIAHGNTEVDHLLYQFNIVAQDSECHCIFAFLIFGHWVCTGN